MKSNTIARYRTRAIMAASSIAILIGASVGSAYLGGRMAHETSDRREAGRLLQFASISRDGKVDASALDKLAPVAERQVDFGALAIALRFSPDGDAMSNNSLLAQNMTALRISDDARLQKLQVVRASLGGTTAERAVAFAATPVTPAAAFAFKSHTQNDADCLAQAVYYEARGEGNDGMRAVAQVILNRVRHPLYPKTICGVVYQGAYMRTSCQFSFVCDGSMGARVEASAWRRAKQVADQALAGAVMPAVGSSTHFHTVNVAPRWAGNMNLITQIGSHIFYQFRGRSSHMGSGANVQPSDGIPAVGPGANDGVIAPADETTAQAIEIADATTAPALQPSTVSPTGEARVQLIKAFNDMQTSGAVKPAGVQAGAQIGGQSARDLSTTLSHPAPAAKTAGKPVAAASQTTAALAAAKAQ